MKPKTEKLLDALLSEIKDKASFDMRKGFDGLSGLIKQEMNRKPVDGNVYLFVNRRRDRIKMLLWESGGFMLYYKRLEKGTIESTTLSTNP